MKRIDLAVVVTDEIKTVEFLFNEANAQNKLDVAFQILTIGTYAGFHPNSKLAKQKFDEGFAIILKNGEAQKIIENWKKKIFITSFSIHEVPYL